MKLIALLAIRNEELYISRCLENLIEQGFDIILIDNDSTDKSIKIANKYLGKGLQEILRFPYSGYYEWEKILKYKEQLFRDTDGDWFLHCDADEIHEPSIGYKTIKEELINIDGQGYNAVNFDEFIFVPTKTSGDFSKKDYVKEMKYYYYYAPYENFRLKLWKKTGQSIDLSSQGGHRIQFDNIRIYPQNMILRHYIFVSKVYAEKKYSGRKFLTDEVRNKGWHGWRANFNKNILRLPQVKELKYLSDGRFDTSEPKSLHPFLQLEGANSSNLLQTFISKLKSHKVFRPEPTK